MSSINQHPDDHRDAIFVSIVIVNWNGAEVLPRCLAALRAQTYRDFELIVVDNGSVDTSISGLEQRWPGVKLICFPENRGFAAANNAGVRQAVGEWVVLLNNDAFPEPDWLNALLAAAQQHPGYHFFGSRLVQADRPDILDGTGDVYHISGLAWRRHYNQPLAQADEHAHEIFSPCAAAAMYQREVFLRVGGFDEDYFTYHEDVDLSFRLRLQGYRCLYLPEATVHHVGSATTGKKSDFSVYYGHRNLVWSYFQNMPGRLFWIYLPAHLFANLAFLVYYSLRGQARAIWRGKWHALLGLPRALRKRRLIQAQCKVHPQEIARVLERGWLKPYLREFRRRQTGK